MSILWIAFNNIQIIYFINTYVNPTYHHLMKPQLSDLVSTGIMSRAHLWIECCGFDPLFSSYVYEELHPYLSRVTITIHPENNHEYFGIHRLWSRSHQVLPSTILLYFHSKGIGYRYYTKEDNRFEVSTRLVNTVIRPWRSVLSMFKEKPSIDKIAYNYSPAGIMWCNFFWNRAAFTRRLEKPVITSDRYYYEEHNSRVPHVYTETDENRPMSDTIYDFRCDNCIGLYDPHPFHPKPSKLLTNVHRLYILIEDEFKHLFVAHKNNPTIILTRYTLPIHEDIKDLNITWDTNEKECRRVKMYINDAELKEIDKYMKTYHITRVSKNVLYIEFDAFFMDNLIYGEQPLLFYYGPEENYLKNTNVTYRLPNKNMYLSTENMNQLFGDTAPNRVKYLSIVSKNTNKVVHIIFLPLITTDI